LGTTIITYAFPTGCRQTASLTVDPLPAPIAGTLNLCLGATTSLSDASPGGSWSSSNLSVAYVDVSTGAVTGLDTGNATITYALTSGCQATAVVTVNPTPTIISGMAGVCLGNSATLFNGVPGGTWSSSNPTV